LLRLQGSSTFLADPFHLFLDSNIVDISSLSEKSFVGFLAVFVLRCGQTKKDFSLSVEMTEISKKRLDCAVCEGVMTGPAGPLT
jgi:hypothetical protein